MEALWDRYAPERHKDRGDPISAVPFSLQYAYQHGESGANSGKNL